MIAGLVASSACYSGLADELDSDAPATSTGAADPTGASGPTSASTPGTAPGETGEPTDGVVTGPGPATDDSATVTASGSTDMSAGTAPDPATGDPATGDPATGEPNTSDPNPSEPGTTGVAETGDPPPDEAAMLCARWNDDRAGLAEGSWNGDVNACNKGALGQEGKDHALRLINLYRFIADLPPVSEDAARSDKAQACALMMHANGALNHNPPMNWKCWTAEGSEAAGKSNISGTPGVLGIDLYMVDPGNDTTIGHRRWILSNSLGGVGFGSTSQSSCLWVIGGNGNGGKAWTAWPPPGLVPLQALHVPTIGWAHVDQTGWTVQSDSIDLGAAQVSIKENGVDRPVASNVLGQGYGSSFAIRFVPQGWEVAAGATYDVTVSGASEPIAYSVTIVDCG